MLKKSVIFLSVFLFIGLTSYCQGPSVEDSVLAKKISGYQIHMKQPVKEIKLLMYEKNFLPVKGKISDDKLSIIMDSYEHGNKVHVKVIYEDGTADEFVRSPC